MHAWLLVAAQMSVTREAALGYNDSPAGDESPARSQTDQLDCFNADLIWIADKLVTRSGGSFGIISRHVQGERAAVLARTTRGPAVVDEFFDELATFAGVSADTECRLHDNASASKQAGWSSGVGPQPNDYRVLLLVFAPTQNVTLVASVARPGATTPFTEAEQLTASRLYPVLSRYVRLWWLHRMERRRANTLSAALDLSDVGVMLLDRSSSLLFANSRATALLERQDGLRRNESYIAATEPRDDLRLQAALQRAIDNNLVVSDAEDDRNGAPFVTLQRAGHQRGLIATVMNVENPAIDPRDPAVIVYLFDPEQSVEQTLEPVCRVYKLTAVETRLVLHLVNGIRLSDAADRMQIRPDTARAYLKHIFTKTMTNRQIDLVRLMYASMTRTSANIDLTALDNWV
jgi:DNA-binding CsgD family transcriptional regulator/PAS domain-containing protein